MSETQSTPAEAPLANDPAARTETGEIKDQSATQSATQPTTETTSQDTESSKTTEAAKPTTPEAKAEGEKKPEAEGPPEKYEFKAPEGVKLSEKTTEAAGAVFKDLGLTQAQADKLVEFHIAQMKEIGEAPLKAFETMRTNWRNEVLGDNALSDGSDLKPEVKATLGRAIDAMGPKLSSEFRSAMDNTGVGDHPAIVRGLLALGKLSTEGTAVTGGNPSAEGQRKPGAVRSAAQALYPNLPSSSGA